MTNAVLLERSDGVAFITLNRPDSLNAINEEVRTLLPALVREADADDAIGAIVVRGAGPRAFCAGADIREFVPVDDPAAYRQSRTHASWIRPFDEALKPIIASVHGYCLGGGFEIALACDIRIASTDTVFGFPETGLGVMTGVGGAQRLLRIAGMGRALDLVLTGERIDAVRAMEMGIVTRTAAPDALAKATAALARAVASKAPLATAFAKEALRCGLDHSLSDAMRLEVGLLSLLLNSEDRIEAAAAFRDKRPPRFRRRGDPSL